MLEFLNSLLLEQGIQHIQDNQGNQHVKAQTSVHEVVCEIIFSDLLAATQGDIQCRKT